MNTSAAGSPKTSRPAASSVIIRQRMQQQRRRDTKPEVAIRRRLHAAGARYRVDTCPEPDLRVRGDIVWRGRKLIVFIDGCFWHGCPEHGTWPRANSDWWRAKITANVARDRRNDAVLRDRGWTVLRFWAHEDFDGVTAHILDLLGKPGKPH
jgi:DNA mismatch endonuclease (patch repair protein)